MFIVGLFSYVHIVISKKLFMNKNKHEYYMNKNKNKSLLAPILCNLIWILKNK